MKKALPYLVAVMVTLVPVIGTIQGAAATP